MSADVDDPVPSRNPGGEAIGTPSVGAIDKRSLPAHLLFSSPPCLYSAMAFTTPTDDLNSPQASSSGSEGLYKEHEGNVLTTMHDEQALEHLLENLPDEKVLKRPFRCRLGTKCCTGFVLHLCTPTPKTSCHSSVLRSSTLCPLAVSGSGKARRCRRPAQSCRNPHLDRPDSAGTITQHSREASTR